MKNNWSQLGKKVKAESNDQDIPIPDFKEFVNYRHSIEPVGGPSLSKPNLGTGPYIKFTIALISIISVAAIMYPLLTKSNTAIITTKDSIEIEAPQQSNIYNKVNLFEAPTDQTNTTSEAKSANQSTVVPKSEVVESVVVNENVVSKKDAVNEIIKNDVPTLATTSSTPTSAANIPQKTSTVNQVAKPTSVSNQATPTTVYVPFKDWNNKDRANNASEDLSKKTIVNFGDNRVKVNSTVFENAKENKTTSENQKETTLTTNTEFEQTTTLPPSTADKESVNKTIVNSVFNKIPTTKFNPLVVDNSSSDLIIPTKDFKEKVKFKYSVTGGLVRNAVKFKIDNFTLGLLVSRPIFKKQGIGLRTGIRYFNSKSLFDLFKEETILDLLGNPTTEDQSLSATNTFHFFEFPLEVTFKLPQFKRIEFVGGVTLQNIVNGVRSQGELPHFQFGLKESSWAGTMGMEFHLSDRWSFGGLYNRSLKSFFSNSFGENTTLTVDGNTHFENARLYVSFRIR